MCKWLSGVPADFCCGRLFQHIRAGIPELQFPVPDVTRVHDSHGALSPISSISLWRAVLLVRLAAQGSLQFK